MIPTFPLKRYLKVPLIYLYNLMFNVKIVSLIILTFVLDNLMNCF